MTPHARLDVPRHTGLRFVVFMLAGKATYAAHEASKSEALEPFDALTTAGTDFHLECSEESCQAFFAAIALRGSLADTLDQAGVSTGVSDDTFRKRTLSEIAPHALPGGAGSASIVFGGNDPDTSFSLTLLRARAGHSIPIHRHERSWENLLLLNGKGELSLRGRPYPLEGGETVHVPPDVRHGFFAAGTEPMSALTLYVPAGPERRFMK
jgi:quercetin dioxygenase-like cupin family protein